MQQPVKERIAKLREEIARIREQTTSTCSAAKRIPPQHRIMSGGSKD